MSSLLTGPYKNISINHPRLPEIANMSQTPTTLTNQWASFNVKCTAVRLRLNTLLRAIQNAEIRIARAEIALEAANGHGEPTAANIQNAREVLEDARAILRSARNKLTRAEDATNAEFRFKNRPGTPLWGSIVISAECLVDEAGRLVGRWVLSPNIASSVCFYTLWYGFQRYIYILYLYLLFHQGTYLLTSHNNVSDFSSFRLTLSINVHVTTPSSTNTRFLVNSS
jgi:hypothetical protein